jgi:hypothetical protein
VKRAVVVCLVLAAAPIWIAGAQSGGRPDPADPSVSGTALRYESAFDGYRDVQDRKLAPWKDANEEMGRLGGHSGHADSAPAGDGTNHEMDHKK